MSLATIGKTVLGFLDLCRCVVGCCAALVGFPLVLWFMFHLAQGVLLFACASATAGSHSHVCYVIQDLPGPIDNLIDKYVPYNPMLVMLISVAIAYITLVIIEEEVQKRRYQVKGPHRNNSRLQQPN